ncbi:hypothetical protein IWQ62_006156 [Dispira parvispora]|uniref:Uncharacterized protein n=1 Tax=Dispira parvispora TaxID=1520584 RepID=A0A9W8ANK1_9FUNG|nr:hypothetical protein IWQ62_006156 [Dispira parvispora]
MVNPSETSGTRLLRLEDSIHARPSPTTAPAAPSISIVGAANRTQSPARNSRRRRSPGQTQATSRPSRHERDSRRSVEVLSTSNESRARPTHGKSVERSREIPSTSTVPSGRRGGAHRRVNITHTATPSTSKTTEGSPRESVNDDREARERNRQYKLGRSQNREWDASKPQRGQRVQPPDNDQQLLSAQSNGRSHSQYTDGPSVQPTRRHHQGGQRFARAKADQDVEQNQKKLDTPADLTDHTESFEQISHPNDQQVQEEPATKVFQYNESLAWDEDGDWDVPTLSTQKP